MIRKCILLVFVLFSLQCSQSEENSNAADKIQEQQILSLVNAYRAKACLCGSNSFAAAPPVKLNAKLMAAAKAHSDDMQRRNQMTHYGKNGESPTQRLAKVGYQWRIWAENVAMGQPNEESVVKAWMESPGHCANIMNPQATEIGVARTGQYWTILLAAPR